MEIFFETLGKAIEESGRQCYTTEIELNIENLDETIEITPITYFLWSTTIIAPNDTSILKVKLFHQTTCKQLWIDSWEGIKAVAFLYLGKVEPLGRATIFWPYVTGEVTGLDLRGVMIGDYVLKLQASNENLGKIILQHKVL